MAAEEGSRENITSIAITFDVFHPPISRIKFPLKGINTDDMEISDTIYYWEKDDWVIHRKIDTNIFDVSLIRSDTLIIEKITTKDYPGLYVESNFKRINHKWYLIYYTDVNL